MNDDLKQWWTQELRSNWNHPEFREGDHQFKTILAEGDELARLERVFHTTQADVVEFIIEDRESGDPEMPNADQYRYGRGTYAERLAACRADYALLFSS